MKIQTSRSFLAKLASRRQRRLSARLGAAGLLLTGSLLLSVGLRADDTWTGANNGTDSNWSDAGNWNNGIPTTSNYGTLTFATTTGSPSNDDIASLSENKLLDTAGAFTINGTGAISLYDNGGTQSKIENNGTSGLFTLNMATINFASTNTSNPWGEINAVTGDITFGTNNTLNVTGSGANGIRLYGGGHTTTFNNTVSASGKYFAMTATSDTVAIGGTFTSGDFYVMNTGVLNLSGSGFTTSGLRLGGDYGTTGTQDQTKSATFNLTDTTGGQTFASPITAVSGNTSGALLIQAKNTSGTDTLSGNFFLDSNLKVSLPQTSTGTLNLGAASSANTISFQSTSSRTLTLNNGGGANGSVVVNESFTNVKDGSDMLVLTGSAQSAVTTINSDNSASGANLLLFNPQSGTLAISSAANLGSPAVSAGYPDKVLFGATTGTTTITLQINGTFSYGSTTSGQVLGFALDKSSGANTAYLNVSGMNAFTMNGALSDYGLAANAGNWQKQGTGTLVLTAANPFAGTFQIAAGTVTATNTQAFGNPATNAAGQINLSLSTAVLNLFNDGTGNNGTIIYGASTAASTGYNFTASTGTLNVGNTSNLSGGTGTSTGNTIQLGTFTFGSGSSTVSLTGSNGYGLNFVGGLTTPGANSITVSSTVPVQYASLVSGAGKVSTFFGTGSQTISGSLSSTTTGTAYSLAVGTSTSGGTPGFLTLKGTSTSDLSGITVAGGSLTAYTAGALSAAPIKLNAANGTNGTTPSATLNLRSDADTNFASAVSTNNALAFINVDEATSAGNNAAHTLTLGALSGTGTGTTANTFTFTNGNGYNLTTGAFTSSGSLNLTNNMTNGTTTVAGITSSSTGAPALTFSGTSATATTVVSAAITQGTGSLGVTQASAGTTTFSSSGSSYLGATKITSGVLSVSSLTNGGTNSSLGASTNTNGNLVISNGALKYTGSGDSTDRLFTIGTSAATDTATLIASGTGAVNFTNSGAIFYNGTSTGHTLILDGTNTGANTFAPLLSNNGTAATSGSSVLKQGAGTWILTNANTYGNGGSVTGSTTTVNGGTLLVNNTTGSGTGTSTVQVNNIGSILGGNGTITGAVIVGDGTNASQLSPGGSATPTGNGTAILKTGALTLAASSIYAVDLNGNVKGTGYDQVSVTGTVTLAGNLSVSLDYTPTATDVFVLISNDGTDAVSGTFASTSGLPGGFSVDYTYNDSTGALTGGNDVALIGAVAVPEPTTVLGGLLALGALGYSRRRTTRRLLGFRRGASRANVA